MIHETAIISKDAKIGSGVEIGAYALVEGDAVLGDATYVAPHARICDGARIGANCRIGSFTVISGDPQDLHFDRALRSGVEIGDGTEVRESATIHRSTIAGDFTKVGRNCLLMASSHIGHDCVVGDNVIMGCFAALAGHTLVSDNVFISGGVMIHQFVRVGTGVIVSGNSASSMDIPPFTNAYARNLIAGLNLIGMKRRGLSREAISEVKSLYMKVYAGGSPRKNALAVIAEGGAKTPEGALFLDFFKPEGRHFLTPLRHKIQES